MVDHEVLRKEFEQKKKEVAQLRSQLHSIHQEKETAFQTLRSFRDQIHSKTQAMTTLKQERDNLTKEVRLLKEEREKLNQEVKGKSEVLKDVEQKKGELTGEFSKHIQERESPGKLKAMIRKLEEKLETEVMSFEKEKQLNKEVKKLKADYKALAGMEEVWKERNTAAANFSQSRKQAQISHHAVQEKAQQSQEKHQALSQLYDDVKKIREEIKPSEETHHKFRIKYQETKQELDKAMKRLHELSKFFDEKEEKRHKSKLQERTDEVKEKIKNRQKLSMDDILAFQASDE